MNESDADLNNKIYEAALAAGIAPTEYGVEYVVDSEIEPEIEIHHPDPWISFKREIALQNREIEAETEAALAKRRRDEETEDAIFWTALIGGAMAATAGVGVVPTIIITVTLYYTTRTVFLR